MASRRMWLVALAGLMWGSSLAQSQVVEQPETPVRVVGHKVVRVTVSTQRQLMTALALTDDIWTCGGTGIGSWDMRVSPGQLAALRTAGIAHSILIDDVQALIDAERARLADQPFDPRGSFFDDHKNLAQIGAYIDQLVAEFPALAAPDQVGNSLEGRAIRAIRVTAPGGPGNRSAVLFNGAQHAREWATPMTVMYIADTLLRGYGVDSRITALLDRAEIILVPVVNPDGYEYTWTTQRLWRKNRRDNAGSTCDGVDTNRNWGSFWGPDFPGSSGDPCSETYRGPSAFSEPETQAMRDFVLAEPRLRAAIDFHSYSQLVMSPYGYTDQTPPDHDEFMQINQSMHDAIRAVHGREYEFGPIYTTIYPANGNAVDWYYDGAGLLGFTIEVRDNGGYGFVMPPEEIRPNAEENFQAAMALAEHVALSLRISFPSGTPTSVPAATAVSFDVQIQEGSGQLDAGSAVLVTSIDGGAAVESALTFVAGDVYRATLPGAPCGSEITFYAQAETEDGETFRAPSGAPADALTAVAVNVEVHATDTLESDSGWTAGAAGDTATTGQWARVDPNGTGAQPEDDHTDAPGVRCFITGQGAPGGGLGEADVDSGSTTLLSPVFDLSGHADAVVSYWRWYSNNAGASPGQDIFLVDITVNNGANWVNAETVGPSGAETQGGWLYHEFRLSDLGLAPGFAMRLRFIASDAAPGSIVEAAVDDLQIRVEGCPCAADYDGDGFVTGNDFDAYVGDFEAGDPGSDFDRDGFVTGLDFDAFVEAFEAGC